MADDNDQTPDAPDFLALQNFTRANLEPGNPVRTALDLYVIPTMETIRAEYLQYMAMLDERIEELEDQISNELTDGDVSNFVMSMLAWMDAAVVHGLPKNALRPDGTWNPSTAPELRRGFEELKPKAVAFIQRVQEMEREEADDDDDDDDEGGPTDPPPPASGGTNG